MKKYSKAPLPFMGQKRNWLKLINSIDFENKIVVDLFGGSGILSHEIKRNNPSARVIWNDFDNYQGRLDQIKDTELLRQKIRTACEVFEKNEKVNDERKEPIIKLIEESGVTDFVTISSWLLFSGNYAHTPKSLYNPPWYPSPPQTPLTSEDYLQGVERVSMNYKDLIKLFENEKNVVFVADPPYIMTNQTGYSGNNDARFRLSSAIHLFKELGKHQSILFSSTKSESDDLLAILDINVTSRHSLITSMMPNRRYEDLCYKINM